MFTFNAMVLQKLTLVNFASMDVDVTSSAMHERILQCHRAISTGSSGALS